jgi:3-keto-disaccharide hydrolase/alpha-L-arabinofuranosidase-like protein
MIPPFKIGNRLMRLQLPSALLSVAITSVLTCASHSQEITIEVHADRVLHTVSPHLTGACIEDVNHEIYGGIYSQMIFGESFQEPPPSPAVIGFKTYGGQWLVDDGAVRIDAADGPKLISERASFADGQVGVEVRFNDRRGQNAGLIVRVDRPGVGADRFVGYEVSLEPARQRLWLARHRNNFEPIKGVKCDVAIGRWIPIEVKLTGPKLEVFVDGKSVLSHDDGKMALLTGTIGLRAWHSQASYRNFWVKAGKEMERLAFSQAERVPQISGMWRAVQVGSAAGEFGTTKTAPFAGTQSQAVNFVSGEGRFGVENQALNRWGMNFVEGKPYEGYVWARAEKPATLFASLENRDGSRSYADTRLDVAAGDWHRVDFTLNPNAGDKAGRFALALKQPGSIVLGHAFLQPGEWGRFKELPVRRDVAEALIDQGITVLRYGGSMVNNAGYQWKKMIGPRDRRPPYSGTWYQYSSNGWGIPDFMDFCEAAGFEYIPAFNMGESPRDMADFIEYTKGSADSQWGRKRVANGHRQPYRLRYLELGNEERVDEKYAARFEVLAKAIWAKDPDIILVVGDFAYDHPIHDPMNFTGAASKITNLAGHRKILSLAREHGREVWFDVHVWTEGPGPSASLKVLPSFIDALAKVADGAKHRVVVFEFNAQNHAVRRALGNALATNTIERDGRLPIVTSANCLQPDGQNDNGWDQGLLFLNPSQVWLQPPGNVTQMLARNYVPQLVKCEVTGEQAKLDAVAKRSADGKTLVLQVVNIGDMALPSVIHVEGFVPERAIGQATTLAGPLNAVNTADQPKTVVPKQTEWVHKIKEGKMSYTFSSHSFTVLRLE